MQVYSIPTKKRAININFSLNTWLIIITAVLSIVFFFLPHEYYALNPASVLSGVYLWTFITSIFAHAGFFHLFVNMLSLFFVGSIIEKILGRKRYFWFYLLSGIFAGLVFVLIEGLIYSFNFPQNYEVFAVGASGALFALIGILIFLTPNLKVYIMFIPIPIKMKYAAPGLLIILWLISIAGDIPLGNFAHLGGLVVGIIYGIYLTKRYPKKTKYISRRFS